MKVMALVMSRLDISDYTLPKHQNQRMDSFRAPSPTFHGLPGNPLSPTQETYSYSLFRLLAFVKV